MDKEAGIGNIGEEELTRLRIGRHSLYDVDGSLRVLFGDTIDKLRASDRERIRKLFVMAEANITQAPNLVKLSKAKNVCAFFEKLSSASITDAQRRYPELLKVANSGVNSVASTTSSTPTPDLKPRKMDSAQGKIPAKSMLAGGAA